MQPQPRLSSLERPRAVVRISRPGVPPLARPGLEDWQLSPKQLPKVHALELEDPRRGPDRPWWLAVSTSAPGGRRV
jgi:hypothetical protein